MSITYPLALPNISEIASMSLRVEFASSNSMNPFDFSDDPFRWPGTRIAGTAKLKPMKRARAEDWVGWAISLKGHTGTFLMGDPQATAPLGTATTGTVSGNAMDETVTVAMTGTLKRGDWLQIGVGADRTLHKVLADASGNGDLEIAPGLRKNRVTEVFTTINPMGLFRMTTRLAEWDVSRVSMYGITFAFSEKIP